MSYETVNVELEDYDFHTKQWTRYPSILHHSIVPFASGGLRYAFKAYNCNLQNWREYPMVLKISKYGQFQDEESGRNQVIMQSKCVKYANEFNSHPSVSKHVSFVSSQLVKFLYGKWAGMYATMERYIGDNFIKHNTVNPEIDGVALTTRNTPQAFSHFTFEKSGKTEIVVDIQGVGDCYTDPQLYSVSLLYQEPYGPADWGIQGISNFFRNHRCNAVCRGLGLDPIRPTDYNSGTVPRYI